MMRHVPVLVIGALAVFLMPAAAGAQPAAPGVEEQQVRVDAVSPPDVGRLWLVGGAAFVATRGDCQTCEEA